MIIADKLAELGLVLPEVPPLPMAPNRAVVTMHGALAFVSGVGPIGVSGVVGGDMSIEAGYHAARTAGLYCLSRLQAELGSLDRIEKWVKVLGFVRSAPGFDRQPEVLNGFSDLVVDIFGEAGRAARSAIGTSELPLNMPVEVEAVLTLR
ncbi:MAG TPA: RidA family protein [Jatrophihabitantaceae bacterium]|jgi:enamine deaminase RidA (YjgF/YER057c/UK114 family)|nr:RidA family protein [Jatrophihabitantaceae bacterium]